MSAAPDEVDGMNEWDGVAERPSPSLLARMGKGV